MKTHRSAVLAVCAALSSISIAGCAHASPPAYKVCEQQIVSYVEHELGQHITDLDITYAEKRISLGLIPFHRGTAVVHVDACDGYHVFDVYGTWEDCIARPHYGRPPPYVSYRTSGGGC
jgi:hypothetical protein